MITESRRVPVSQHGITAVWQDPSTGHHSLHSTRVYQPGDVITPFEAASIEPVPGYLTLQVSDNQHIMLSPAFLEYVNHSCSPNAFFNTDTFEFTCLKPVQPGDQLTFFYPSTEWEMAQSFTCRCGSFNCLGEIRGASQMPSGILAQYRLTGYIREKLKARDNHS